MVYCYLERNTCFQISSLSSSSLPPGIHLGSWNPQAKSFGVSDHSTSCKGAASGSTFGSGASGLKVEFFSLRDCQGLPFLDVPAGFSHRQAPAKLWTPRCSADLRVQAWTPWEAERVFTQSLFSDLGPHSFFIRI